MYQWTTGRGVNIASGKKYHKNGTKVRYVKIAFLTQTYNYHTVIYQMLYSPVFRTPWVTKTYHFIVRVSFSFNLVFKVSVIFYFKRENKSVGSIFIGHECFFSNR